MKKFSVKRVLDEVGQVKAGTLHRSDSEVYQEWAELADGWLASGDGDYHIDGFEGFKDRSPNQIVVDFHFNDRLTRPLQKTKLNELLDELNRKPATPLVIHIADGVVNKAQLCKDATHAEQMFRDKVLELIPAANNWDEFEWEAAIDNGYVELGLTGSVCLCWAD